MLLPKRSYNAVHASPVKRHIPETTTRLAPVQRISRYQFLLILQHTILFVVLINVKNGTLS